MKSEMLCEMMAKDKQEQIEKENYRLNGKKVALEELCKVDPYWAANRIRHYKGLLEAKPMDRIRKVVQEALQSWNILCSDVQEDGDLCLISDCAKSDILYQIFQELNIEEELRDD